MEKFKSFNVIGNGNVAEKVNTKVFFVGIITILMIFFTVYSASAVTEHLWLNPSGTPPPYDSITNGATGEFNFIPNADITLTGLEIFLAQSPASAWPITITDTSNSTVIYSQSLNGGLNHSVSVNLLANRTYRFSVNGIVPGMGCDVGGAPTISSTNLDFISVTSDMCIGGEGGATILDGIYYELTPSQIGTPPTATKFNGASTNFGSVPDLNSVAGAVLENTSVGSIYFNAPINVSGADLDSYVYFAPNLVGIDSNAIPGLNVSANLTIQVSGLTNAEVLRDGQPCGAICSGMTYNGSDLKVTVSQFSNYSGGNGTVYVNCSDIFDGNVEAGTYNLDESCTLTTQQNFNSDVTLNCNGNNLSMNSGSASLMLYFGQNNVINDCSIDAQLSGGTYPAVFRAQNNATLNNIVVHDSNTNFRIVWNDGGSGITYNNLTLRNIYTGGGGDSIFDVHGHTGLVVNGFSGYNLTSNSMVLRFSDSTVAVSNLACYNCSSSGSSVLNVFWSGDINFTNVYFYNARQTGTNSVISIGGNAYGAINARLTNFTLDSPYANDADVFDTSGANITIDGFTFKNYLGIGYVVGPYFWGEGKVDWRNMRFENMSIASFNNLMGVQGTVDGVVMDNISFINLSSWGTGNTAPLSVEVNNDVTITNVLFDGLSGYWNKLVQGHQNDLSYSTTFENVTLRNINISSGARGLIDNFGGNLTLRNWRIEDFTRSGASNAYPIFVNGNGAGAYMLMDNMDFSGVNLSGSGIANLIGSTNKGYIILTNSLFNHTSVPNYIIFFNNGDGSCTTSTCQITNNRYYLDSASGLYTIGGSNGPVYINNNTDENPCGAGYFNSGSYTMTQNCTFSTLQPTAPSYIDCNGNTITLTSNNWNGVVIQNGNSVEFNNCNLVATGGGSSFFANGGNALVNNSILDTSASSRGLVQWNNNNVVIQNSNVILGDQTSDFCGGSMDIYNSSVKDLDYSNWCGGAVHMSVIDSTLTYTASNSVGNGAIGASAVDTIFTGNRIYINRNYTVDALDAWGGTIFNVSNNYFEITSFGGLGNQFMASISTNIDVSNNIFNISGRTARTLGLYGNDFITAKNNIIYGTGTEEIAFIACGNASMGSVVDNTTVDITNTIALTEICANDLRETASITNTFTNGRNVTIALDASNTAPRKTGNYTGEVNRIIDGQGANSYLGVVTIDFDSSVTFSNVNIYDAFKASARSTTIDSVLIPDAATTNASVFFRQTYIYDNTSYAIKKDGAICTTCLDIVFGGNGNLSFRVQGFSNYTIEGLPGIASFVANSYVLNYGATTQLNFSTIDATDLDLNGINVTGLSAYNITPLVNTTYTLTATNSYGIVNANLSIGVSAPTLISTCGNYVAGLTYYLSDNITLTESASIGTSCINIVNSTSALTTRFYANGYYFADIWNSGNKSFTYFIGIANTNTGGIVNIYDTKYFSTSNGSGTGAFGIVTVGGSSNMIVNIMNALMTGAYSTNLMQGNFYTDLNRGNYTIIGLNMNTVNAATPFSGAGNVYIYNSSGIGRYNYIGSNPVGTKAEFKMFDTNYSASASNISVISRANNTGRTNNFSSIIIQRNRLPATDRLFPAGITTAFQLDSYNITGNYWGSYSPICTDANGNGICDVPFTTLDGYTDYAPYSICSIFDGNVEAGIYNLHGNPCVVTPQVLANGVTIYNGTINGILIISNVNVNLSNLVLSIKPNVSNSNITVSGNTLNYYTVNTVSGTLAPLEESTTLNPVSVGYSINGQAVAPTECYTSLNNTFSPAGVNVTVSDCAGIVALAYTVSPGVHAVNVKLVDELGSYINSDFNLTVPVLDALRPLNNSVELTFAAGGNTSGGISIKDTGNTPLSTVTMQAYDLIGGTNPSIKLNASHFRMGRTLVESQPLIDSVPVNSNLTVVPGQSNATNLYLSIPADQFPQVYYSSTPWQLTVS
jgi:hypothetical protein